MTKNFRSTPIVVICASAFCTTLLTACPPKSNKRPTTPPGQTSLRYNCDLSAIGGGLSLESGVKAFHFSWLESTGPQGAGKILVSDDTYFQNESAVIFVVDNEKHIVDQVRDRLGNPLSFELNKRYLTIPEATTQLHMRVGNLILDSSSRALQSAPKNADSVTFRFDESFYQFKISETIPTVENYAQLPRAISSLDTVVCSFDGFTKTSPSSGGGN
jgi:hypothetical protein